MSKIAMPVYQQVSTITGYKTSDGRIFGNQVDAEIWQHKINKYDEIRHYFQSKLFKYEELNPHKEILHREVITQIFEAIFFDLDIYDTECFLARTREKYENL